MVFPAGVFKSSLLLIINNIIYNICRFLSNDFNLCVSCNLFILHKDTKSIHVLLRIQFILYSVQCILYIVHCTVYNVH